MRYTSRHFTYLLTYLLTYINEMSADVSGSLTEMTDRQTSHRDSGECLSVL